MKQEFSKLLDEIKQTRVLNKQKNSLPIIPIQVGDTFVFNSESVTRESMTDENTGKTYVWINFISKQNGNALTEKHFIKSNNGLSFKSDSYVERLEEFLNMVEKGLTLVVTEIKTTPNIFENSGRTQHYIFKVVE